MDAKVKRLLYAVMSNIVCLFLIGLISGKFVAT